MESNIQKQECPRLADLSGISLPPFNRKVKDKARQQLWDSLLEVYEKEKEVTNLEEQTEPYNENSNSHKIVKSDTKKKKKRKFRDYKNIIPHLVNEKNVNEQQSEQTKERQKLKKSQKEKNGRRYSEMINNPYRNENINSSDVLILHQYSGKTFQKSHEQIDFKPHSRYKHYNKVSKKHKDSKYVQQEKTLGTSLEKLHSKSKKSMIEHCNSVIKNIANFNDKIKKRQDVHVVCNTLKNNLQPTVKKKRCKMLNQQNLDVSKSVDLKGSILNQIKNLPIKVDEKQLVFMEPSHIAKVLQYCRGNCKLDENRTYSFTKEIKLNQSNSLCLDINTKECLTESFLKLGSEKPSKQLRILPSLKRLKKHKPFFMKDNFFSPENSPIEDIPKCFNNVSKHKKITTRRKGKYSLAEKEKSKNSSPMTKGGFRAVTYKEEIVQKRDSDMRRVYELISTDQTTSRECKIDDLKNNTCSQIKKLSTICSESIDVWPEKRDSTIIQLTNAVTSKNDNTKKCTNTRPSQNKNYNNKIRELNGYIANNHNDEKKNLTKINLVRPSISEDGKKLRFQLTRSGTAAKNIKKVQKNIYSISDRRVLKTAKEKHSSLQKDNVMLFYANRESSGTSKESLNIAISRDTEISDHGSSNNVLNVVIKQTKNSVSTTNTPHFRKCNFKKQNNQTCYLQTEKDEFMSYKQLQDTKLIAGGEENLNEETFLKEVECQTEEYSLKNTIPNSLYSPYKIEGLNNPSLLFDHKNNNLNVCEFNKYLNPVTDLTNAKSVENKMNTTELTQEHSYIPTLIRNENLNVQKVTKHAQNLLSNKYDNYDNLKSGQFYSELRTCSGKNGKNACDKSIYKADFPNENKFNDNQQGYCIVKEGDKFNNLNLIKNQLKITESDILALKLKQIGLTNKSSFVRMIDSDENVQQSHNKNMDLSNKPINIIVNKETCLSTMQNSNMGETQINQCEIKNKGDVFIQSNLIGDSIKQEETRNEVNILSNQIKNLEIPNSMECFMKEKSNMESSQFCKLENWCDTKKENDFEYCPIIKDVNKELFYKNNTVYDIVERIDANISCSADMKVINSFGVSDYIPCNENNKNEIKTIKDKTSHILLTHLNRCTKEKENNIDKDQLEEYKEINKKGFVTILPVNKSVGTVDDKLNFEFNDILLTQDENTEPIIQNITNTVIKNTIAVSEAGVQTENKNELITFKYQIGNAEISNTNEYTRKIENNNKTDQTSNLQQTNRNNFFVVLPKSENNINNKLKSDKSEPVYTKLDCINGPKCTKSSFSITMPDVSDIGTQTDKGIDYFSVNSNSIYCLNRSPGTVKPTFVAKKSDKPAFLLHEKSSSERLTINDFLLFEENLKNKIPLRKCSFVHIINTEIEKGTNTLVESESNSGKISYENSNIDCFIKNISNRCHLLHDKNYLSLTTNENKNEEKIMTKINVIYEFLQYVDNILRNNEFLKKNENCKTSSSIGKFNNTLRCLCSNCIEIINKVEVKQSINKCGNQENSCVSQLIDKSLPVPFKDICYNISETKGEFELKTKAISNVPYLNMNDVENTLNHDSNCSTQFKNTDRRPFFVVVPSNEKFSDSIEENHIDSSLILKKNNYPKKFKEFKVDFKSDQLQFNLEDQIDTMLIEKKINNTLAEENNEKFNESETDRFTTQESQKWKDWNKINNLINQEKNYKFMNEKLNDYITSTFSFDGNILEINREGETNTEHNTKLVSSQCTFNLGSREEAYSSNCLDESQEYLTYLKYLENKENKTYEDSSYQNKADSFTRQRQCAQIEPNFQKCSGDYYKTNVEQEYTMQNEGKNKCLLPNQKIKSEPSNIPLNNMVGKSDCLDCEIKSKLLKGEKYLVNNLNENYNGSVHRNKIHLKLNNFMHNNNSLLNNTCKYIDKPIVESEKNVDKQPKFYIEKLKNKEGVSVNLNQSDDHPIIYKNEKENPFLLTELYQANYHTNTVDWVSNKPKYGNFYSYTSDSEPSIRNSFHLRENWNENETENSNYEQKAQILSRTDLKLNETGNNDDKEFSLSNDSSIKSDTEKYTNFIKSKEMNWNNDSLNKRDLKAVTFNMSNEHLNKGVLNNMFNAESKKQSNTYMNTLRVTDSKSSLDSSFSQCNDSIVFVNKYFPNVEERNSRSGSKRLLAENSKARSKLTQLHSPSGYNFSKIVEKYKNSLFDPNGWTSLSSSDLHSTDTTKTSVDSNNAKREQIDLTVNDIMYSDFYSQPSNPADSSTGQNN